MIKGSIQENMTHLNIHAPNIGAPEYTKQIFTDLNGDIDNKTIIVGDFNTPQTSMDRSSRQKINKETADSNGYLGQLDLIDIYSTFHLNPAEHTFSSTAHGTFSRIDHMLGHKTSLNKFKRL